MDLRKIAALLLALVMLLGLTACAAETEDVLSADDEVITAPDELAADDAEPDEAPAPAPEADEPDAAPDETPEPADDAAPLPDPDGSYTTRDDVALYLLAYGELPPNFITKKEARALGWSGGGLDDYAPGKCIGGDVFGNYEGLLPADASYHECDIDTLGASSRGAKRLVYTDDGLIYYTDDHYESFTLIADGELLP